MRTGLQVVSASLRTIKSSQCGECKECCIAFPICDGDVDKPGNDPCKHLGEQGCNIYANRPTTCQDYLCMWRQDAYMAKRLLHRPDNLGVVFDTQPGDGGRLVLRCVEVRANAFEENANTIDWLLSHLRNNYSVGTITRHPFGSIV